MSYHTSFLAELKPDPLLTVSEWADQNRLLSQTASSEPGRWRTDRTPYLREIMDCLSPRNATEKVVFMKGAQIGGTEAGNNWVGYIVDQAPGPMLVVQPTVEMGKRWSKGRLAPLLEDTPCLKGKVKDPRSRDSGNTVQSKEFQGGIVVVTGANSAVGLRSMPVRYLFLDEVDAYPGDADGEGDPVSLAIQRTATFARRKIFLVSTPTIQGASRIEMEYEASDQRRFHVPCPHCGFMQPLVWSQMHDDESGASWKYSLLSSIPSKKRGNLALKDNQASSKGHASALTNCPSSFSSSLPFCLSEYTPVPFMASCICFWFSRNSSRDTGTGHWQGIPLLFFFSLRGSRPKIIR